MTCAQALDLVGEALENSLADPERAGFEDHLGECAACRTYVEQIRLTLLALEALPPPEAANPHREALLAQFRKKHH